MHERIDADGLSLKGSSMSLGCSLETTERTRQESVGERRSLTLMQSCTVALEYNYHSLGGQTHESRFPCT